MISGMQCICRAQTVIASTDCNRLPVTVTLDVPGAVLTEANGINPRGDIVGDYNDSGGNTHGYLLSK